MISFEEKHSILDRFLFKSTSKSHVGQKYEDHKRCLQ
jgi:hypothetical protein